MELNLLLENNSVGVVAYASQMLTNATPETTRLHKIFRSAGEMIADGEGAFSALYIGERSDELAGLTPGPVTCM